MARPLQPSPHPSSASVPTLASPHPVSGSYTQPIAHTQMPCGPRGAQYTQALCLPRPRGPLLP